MTINFTEDVIKAFSKIGKDIDESSSEPDIRRRIILHFIRGVSGYRGKEYQDEKKRTDLTIYDKNGFRPIVIETKKLSEIKKRIFFIL